MGWFITVLLLIVLGFTKTNEDKVRAEAYREGYNDGVEDTRKFYENLKKNSAE